MKYNPIMCMNVHDSVKTKDGLDDPEKNAGYEMKKEGQYFKIYKNGKLIAMSSTEEEARRAALSHRAANNSKTIDKAIRNCDKEYKMKVTSYVINKGQSGEYYGLKNKETNQVLYSAPNNWKSREGAKRWAEKKGMIYED